MKDQKVFFSTFFCLFFVLCIQKSSYSQSTTNSQTIVEIAQNLYVMPAGGSYSTIFEGDNEILIIDTGLEYQSEKSDSIIKSNFHKPVKYIINSHSHFDHVGGNKNFADNNTIIIGHENVRKEMKKTWKAPETFNFLPVIQPYSEESLPDICYMDSMEIHFNNEIVKIYHVPNAHTIGDSYVYFKNANAIHTGDIFINVNGFPPFECSFDGVIKAFDKLINLCDNNTIVIPGHGPVSDKEGVIHQKNILLQAAERITELKKEGKSYEEIVELKPLVGLFEGKKYLPDAMFIYTVYNDNWKN